MINEKIIREISVSKKEPSWMLKKRLKALKIFNKLKMPDWGPELSKLKFDELTYFVKPGAKQTRSWNEVPKDIKETFEKLGIPEAERKALAGVGAQYESETVYHNLKKEWEEKGVIFLDMDEALRKHPSLVKKYFSKCVPITDHKFAALHFAVWSGGTFLYIPKNVKVNMPLQAYFRMNSPAMGQFEHTLIIVDEGAEVHYLEGCSAPQYTENNIHAGCVEVFVSKNSRMRYSSVENWSRNTYNLNTKRAIVEDNGLIEWVGGNLGSGVTMLYPCSVLKGKNSKSDYLGIAFAGKGQNQDTGGKVIHIGENTRSTLISKSISKDGGISTYRGLVKILPGAKNARSSINCNALLFEDSVSKTKPLMRVNEKTASVSHEASVGKISDNQIYYMMSRGLNEEQATQLIVSGFIAPIVKELPIEYALEFNRLIQLEMENSIG